MASIVVAGALANKPGNGGEAWVRLSWAEGFRALGYDTYLFEQLHPATAVDRAGRAAAVADSWNLEWFRHVTTTFGWAERAVLIDAGTGESHGMAADRPGDIADDAVLLVNISGHLQMPKLLQRFGRRAYVDIDPGFTQIWDAQGVTGLGLEQHHVHFTVAANIGRPECPIPTVGRDWRHVPPPVVLDSWPVAAGGAPDRFTTVASWRGPYGPLAYGGRSFGLKVHEFRKFVDIPRRCRASFEVALAIHPDDDADRKLLEDRGWALVEPAEVAGDPASFQHYVQTSPAELSVAQGVYVATASGWFSDRTVRYLASGRPALVQDTGVGSWLPTGEGLLPFATLEEAVAAVGVVQRDYDGHRQAARALAEQYFAAERVLPVFLDQAGVA